MIYNRGNTITIGISLIMARQDNPSVREPAPFLTLVYILAMGKDEA